MCRTGLRWLLAAGCGLLILIATPKQGAAQTPPAKKKAAAGGAGEAQKIDPFDRPEGSIVNQSARFYVWYDKQGWHVRSTAKAGRAFAGVIRLKDAKVKSCVPIGLRDGKQKGVADMVKFNDDRSNVKFTFRTGQFSDGIDLVVDGDAGQIEFELTIDGKQNPKAIFIGSGKQHPTSSPFTFPAAPQRAK